MSQWERRLSRLEVGFDQLAALLERHLTAHGDTVVSGIQLVRFPGGAAADVHAIRERVFPALPRTWGLGGGMSEDESNTDSTATMILRRRTAQWREALDALEDCCVQFAPRTTDRGGGLTTGGIAALRTAFKVLGWEDPHPWNPGGDGDDEGSAPC